MLAATLDAALIAAACLGSFAATSSGTTRAPFLLEMARDLDVSMPLVANLVSMTATAWGIASALGGWLSDRFGRRPLLIAAPFALALAMTAQAFAGNFLYSTGANEVAGRHTRGHFDFPMRGCTVTLDDTVVIDAGKVSQ